MTAPETDWNIVALVISFFVWALLVLYLQFKINFWKSRYRSSENDKQKALKLLDIICDPEHDVETTSQAMTEAEHLLTKNELKKYNF